MPAFGVYPIADVLTAGDEVSSTYEGRHVTLVENELIHKAGNVGGFVNHGDAVVFGTVGLQAVGVAFTTAAAATDLVAVDTEGIWILPVLPSDDGGQVDVDGGDRLYISITTAIISKIADSATNVPFGYALGHIDAGATAETIAVKVHWDPIDNWILDVENFYFGDAKDVRVSWDETNLVFLPVTDNTGVFMIGNGTLSMDFQVFGATVAEYMLYDNSATTLDIVSALAGVATDHAVCITATDATAYAAANSSNGLYVNYTNAGIKTANAECDGIAADVDASADTVFLYAFSAYVGANTGATINRRAGLSVYMDTPAGTINGNNCLYLGLCGGGTTDDFIAIRSFAGGPQDAIISDRSGGATATYLLVLEGVNAPAEAFNAAGNGVNSIAVLINGVPQYLHTYDAP